VTEYIGTTSRGFGKHWELGLRRGESCLCVLWLVFFSFSRHLSVVGLRPSSSLSTGFVMSLRGDWAIFCHAGSGWVGRVRSAREKSLEILRRGWELNPGHGEDRKWAIPLSYHDWLVNHDINRSNAQVHMVPRVGRTYWAEKRSTRNAERRREEWVQPGMTVRVFMTSQWHKWLNVTGPAVGNSVSE